MPTGDLPLPDPPPGNPSTSVQILSDSIRNTRDAPAANDASLDIAMTVVPDPFPPSEAHVPAPPAPPQPETTSASTLRKLLEAPDSQMQNGKVSLDASMVSMLLQLIDREDEQKRQLQVATKVATKEFQLMIADLRDLKGRVETIEAAQLNNQAEPDPHEVVRALGSPQKTAPPAATHQN